ncbi:PASTA domain-containing protein [Arthrobacter wenxiniae]|uniref:PASTA domain-containing protein n=1 Tax=Arthrobacter wenxiniae TaxID=2713570 RepID=A0A7Y7III2_9MICC|nr:PASTA domain-containing protein [Arthrobacter wenxiniae]NVM96104.1 PASTA domain-containing protein [Arthrobacter wenxiniae]
MKKLLVPLALTALFLAGCGQTTAQVAPSSSATKTALAATALPDIEGQPYAKAAAALSAARIDYRAVGPDGLTCINRPDDNAAISSINFTTGQPVPKGSPVILTMDQSEADVVSALVQSA